MKNRRLIVVKGRCYPANITRDERTFQYRASYAMGSFPFMRWDSVGDTIEEACDHLSVFMRDYT